MADNSETSKVSLKEIYRGQDLSGLRNRNLDVIMSAIWDNVPVSRTELAKITGLARSSITRLIQELEELKLIMNVGKGESSGGRQPTLIAPNPDAGLTISLEMDGRNMRGGIFDSANHLLQLHEEPLRGHGPENVRDQLLAVTRILFEASKADTRPLFGIGVGVSGRVDENSGKIIESYNLGLSDFPIRSILEDTYSLPFYVETDASVAAIAERYFGAGRNAEDLVYLLLSTGVGAGVIIDGEIYRGKAGMPGEIGHIIVDRLGPVCLCGRRGCLEAVASEAAILSNAKKLILHGVEYLGYTHEPIDGDLTLSLLANLAENGNPTAHNLIRNAADHVAYAISTISTILNVELIILGGRVIQELGSLFFDGVQESLGNYRQHIQSIRIKQASLETNAFLKGISMITLREILRKTM